MILVDSSVWVGFFRGTDSAEVQRLADLLADGGAPLAMADLVLFEVLRGFTHEQDFHAACRTLAALPVLAIGGEPEAQRAVGHYRALRAQGRTVSSVVDVLLASFCIEHDHVLLHADRDFDGLESLRGLKVWRH